MIAEVRTEYGQEIAERVKAREGEMDIHALGGCSYRMEQRTCNHYGSRMPISIYQTTNMQSSHIHGGSTGKKLESWSGLSY